MSKLDEIILQMPGAVLHTDKAGYNTVHRKAVVAKQQIKDLMLELIGEDTELIVPLAGIDNHNAVQRHIGGNQVKDELRRKVKEL